MKSLFAIFIAIAGLLWYIAVATLDRGDHDKINLRWATDPNPARLVQTHLFSEINPDLTVSVEAGAMEKLLVQCATGTGPDIIDIYNAAQMSGYVQAGLLLDLTPYAESMGFGAGNTYQSLADGLSINGRQYRYPCNVAVNAVVFNRDIFDDHDIPYPDSSWTYDDLIEIGKRFATPGKSGKTHLAVANLESLQLFRDMLWGHGGSYFRDNGLASNMDSPEAIAAMQLYHDMIHVHGVVPTPEVASSMSAQGGWGSGAITWFSNERAAMMFIGRWYLITLVNYPGMAEKIGAVPLPGVGDRPSCGFIDSRAAGINAKSPHIEEALKFLQFLASEEYNKLIVRDGDSLPPNPAYAADGLSLANKMKPDPDFHQVFVDAAKNARTIDISPFIDALQAERWLSERIARVENNPGIDIPAMMQELAREVNRRIRRNLERNRHLQETYEERTGRSYRNDW